MWRSISWRTLCGLAVAVIATAQQIRVDFPAGAPVAVESADWGESRVAPRGGALVLDLRAVIALKNTSTLRIRGVTLLVSAADLTAGGKASVTVPSLDIKPGETFPVRVDMRLLRPAAGLATPVAVSLDGVLFDTLGFYGPNKLDSRRSMIAWELEARRDRKMFLDALKRGGPDELRREFIASVARQDASPRLDVQLARGRLTTADAHDVQIAALALPDAPVEIERGIVAMAAREMSAPRLTLRNRSTKPVRHVEIGWVLRDANGRDHAAGSMPASVAIAGGARASVEENSTLRYSLAPASMAGYVSLVEFADGEVWVPKKSVRGASPEEQRLADLYRRRGLDFVMSELRRLE